MNISEFNIKHKAKGCYFAEKDGKDICIPFKFVNQHGTIQSWKVDQWKKKKVTDDYKIFDPTRNTGKASMQEVEIEITIVKTIIVTRKVPIWCPNSQIKEFSTPSNIKERQNITKKFIPNWILKKKITELEDNYKKIAKDKGKIFNDIVVKFGEQLHVE